MSQLDARSFSQLLDDLATTPTTGETVEQARALVDAFTGGAQRYDGRMIEAMHVEEAKAIIERSARLRS